MFKVKISVSNLFVFQIYFWLMVLYKVFNFGAINSRIWFMYISDTFTKKGRKVTGHSKIKFLGFPPSVYDFFLYNAWVSGYLDLKLYNLSPFGGFLGVFMQKGTNCEILNLNNRRLSWLGIPAVPRREGSDQLIVTLYTQSIYPFVHKKLIRTLFESHIV